MSAGNPGSITSPPPSLRLSGEAPPELLDPCNAEEALAAGRERTPPPLVSLERVTRRFGRGRSARLVLDCLSLSVEANSAVWIYGRNGSGKTTLLRIISGVLLPDSGEVLVRGLRPDSGWRRFHEGIGFLSAGDRGLYARLTVRGHLDYCAALSLLPGAERRARIEAAIDAFALGDLVDRRAERLSQGQRQRLRLALTLVHEPVVLLLDEPGNSLDDDGLQMLRAAVDRVLARDGVVICCSPPGEGQPLCFDRRLALSDGRLDRA